MLNLGDLGFLLFSAVVIGLSYYFMVVKKKKINLETAKNIVNENNGEVLMEETNEENPNQNLHVSKAKKSKLSSKQEAKRQARKEEKRRQKEVKAEKN